MPDEPDVPDVPDEPEVPDEPADPEPAPEPISVTTPEESFCLSFPSNVSKPIKIPDDGVAAPDISVKVESEIILIYNNFFYILYILFCQMAFIFYICKNYGTLHKRIFNE